jgi:2-polyprenyl-6-methoxyphenol hydroxylase-like FAD-dependent oxidoreductase
MLTATDPTAPPPPDLHAAAAALATGFPVPLPGLIAATDPHDVQRWVLRDRKPLRQWSVGRITLAGDAAHATSPYGAGMSIEDAYFLGRALRAVDLSDYSAVCAALQAYEDPRKPHTRRQVQQAWMPPAGVPRSLPCRDPCHASQRIAGC